MADPEIHVRLNRFERRIATLEDALGPIAKTAANWLGRIEALERAREEEGAATRADLLLLAGIARGWSMALESGGRDPSVVALEMREASEAIVAKYAPELVPSLAGKVR